MSYSLPPNATEITKALDGVKWHAGKLVAQIHELNKVIADKNVQIELLQGELALLQKKYDDIHRSIGNLSCNQMHA